MQCSVVSRALCRHRALNEPALLLTEAAMGQKGHTAGSRGISAPHITQPEVAYVMTSTATESASFSRCLDPDGSKVPQKWSQ